MTNRKLHLSSRSCGHTVGLPDPHRWGKLGEHRDFDGKQLPEEAAKSMCTCRAAGAALAPEGKGRKGQIGDSRKPPAERKEAGSQCYTLYPSVFVIFSKRKDW